MQTRTGSTAAADLPEVDSAALDAAMQAHPVVLDVIERMAATRRAVAAERDQAAADRDKAEKDLATEKAAHRKTKAALEVVKDVNEKMLKAIGTLPAAMEAATPSAPAGSPTLTDAEALAKWEAMGPEERAAVMVKAAPRRRFDVRGAAPGMESMFG